VQPRKFPAPVEHVDGGSIALRGGNIVLQNLTGNYGGDELYLREARVPLEDPGRKIQLSDLREQVLVSDITGSIVFHQPGPRYPAALGKVVDWLRPSGPFALGWWYGINRREPGGVKPKPDWSFRVTSEQGQFALARGKIPMTGVHGEVAHRWVASSEPHGTLIMAFAALSLLRTGVTSRRRRQVSGRRGRRCPAATPG